MPEKRRRVRPTVTAQEKGKRNTLIKAPAVKDVEAKLEPQSDVSANSNGAIKAIKTETVKEIVMAKSEVPTKVRELETFKAVVAPLDTPKTADSDLINWDDSPTNDKGPTHNLDVFTDDIDIFADDCTDNALAGTNSETEKANTTKVKGDQVAPTTKLTEQAEQIEATRDVNANEDIAKQKEVENQENPGAVSAFGRNVIFQSIKYNLDNTENLAYWISLGAAGFTETRQINAGNIKLEISVKYLGPEKKGPVAKKNEPTSKTQETEKAGNTQKAVNGDIKEDFPDDAQEIILPSIETRPELTVDTAEAAKKQFHDTVLTPVTSATATPNRQSVACRFGANCSRRDTCAFDHSEGARKKMCTFVNTAVGCKNEACPFSHDHLGVACKSSLYRSSCPNTHKCAFKHQDDITSGKIELTKPETTVALDDDNRQLTAAEIAQKAAMARASREVSVASAVSGPPSNAPTSPQRGVKRSRGNEDADVGPNAQRPRTNNFQMAPNQVRQQQSNQPGQQQGYGPQQGFHNANSGGH